MTTDSKGLNQGEPTDNQKNENRQNISLQVRKFVIEIYESLTFKIMVRSTFRGGQIGSPVGNDRTI